MGKKKKKIAPEETGMDRLKKIALWQWGLIVIFSAVMSNIIMNFVPMEASSSAERRGQALGRLIVMLLGFFIGSAMIIVHLVRSKRK
ncbi:MAG: hypothetical protein HUJ26_24015 [Planctomycetaceae bacterium]|nr:hypothetical protein [Planctomycetaceae bacterium]